MPQAAASTDDNSRSAPPQGWSWGASALARVEDLACALADPAEWPLGPLSVGGLTLARGGELEAWMSERGWALADQGSAGCMWMRGQGAEPSAPSHPEIEELWRSIRAWGARAEADIIAPELPEAGARREGRGWI